MAYCIFIALTYGFYKFLCRLGAFFEEIISRNKNGGIVIEYGVNIAESEIVRGEILKLCLDSCPTVEYPYGIN